MFSQLPPANDDDDDSSNHAANNASSNLPWHQKISRALHLTILLTLSATTFLLFLQTQAISLRLSSTQSQLQELQHKLETSTQDIEIQVEKQHDLTVIHMAGTFALLSCLISSFHMTAHLRKMNQPSVQRKILAILWMSPIYAVTSFLSLVFPPSAEGYLDILKNFYESYVIYQFLSFLIAVLGRGDRGAVVRTLSRHADHLDRPYRCLYCLFHPKPEEGGSEAMANAVLLECQVLAMQFVFFRPLTSILGFVLDLIEGDQVGDEGSGSHVSWSFFYSPRFFVLLVENVSVFFAFAGLLKFYHAVREELAWCQPFAKFMTIKGVVFMTFWQGVVISIIFHANNNIDDDDDDGNTSSTPNNNPNSITSPQKIQSILICMEMLLFSIAHFCVFPAEEWEEGYKIRYYEGPGFGFQDFAEDVSMIIDSGKRSLRARKGINREENGNIGVGNGERVRLESFCEENEIVDGLNGSNRVAPSSSSFGSMDDVVVGTDDGVDQKALV
mmetsp:Transcript_4798/g.9786  ORF Transcript_4798/g.9786 Transcript_4798/m.9786 type:complete len:500 (-) Transcript_4798:58-1557(-)